MTVRYFTQAERQRTHSTPCIASTAPKQKAGEVPGFLLAEKALDQAAQAALRMLLSVALGRITALHFSGSAL